MNNPESSEQLDEKSDALSELKRLILGSEQDSIAELNHHVFDLEQRAEDVAEVLPESIQSASEDKTSLVSALADVNYASIRNLIDKDPNSFADALFPVMGPAIRKSINETLKSFMQSLNHALEQNTSAQGLKWRWEAFRKGVTYSELVLKYTLVYRVDEVFLIHRNSGLLISHLAHPTVDMQDSDAVSAMLTAIQDFVKDSFASGDNSGLDTVELGDHTLWIVHGPHAILACAIRGIAPLELRADFKQVLESIHSRYGATLRDFDGDQANFSEAKDYLQACLQDQSALPKSETKKKVISTPLLVILIVLLMFTTIITWYNIDKTNRLQMLEAELNARDGVIVYSSDLSNDPYRFNLLLDPVADDITELPGKYGFSDDDVLLLSNPYRSLDTSIQERRMRQILQAPESVILRSESRTLFISGNAPIEWKEKIASLNPHTYEYESWNTQQLLADYSALLQQIRSKFNIPDNIVVDVVNNTMTFSGAAPADWLHWFDNQALEINDISSIDLTGLRPEQASLIRWIRQVLDVPAGAHIEVSANRAVISGSAPYLWSRQVQSRSAEIPWIDTVDTDRLEFDEALEFRRLKLALESQSLYFKDQAELTQVSKALLNSTTAAVARLKDLADILEREISVDVTGFADGLGAQRKNRSLALKRAEKIKQVLSTNTDIDPDKFVVSAGENIDLAEVDYSQRRVDIRIIDNEKNKN